MIMIVEVLEAAGVEIHYGTGGEISICCPFCSERGESEDTKFRLGINTVKGVAHDFNCGWRGHGAAYIAKQLARVFGVKLLYRKPETLAVRTPVVETPPIAPIATVGVPEGFEVFTQHPNRVERQARQYLDQRGVSVLQIVAHKMGYAAAGEYAYRILIPVLDENGVSHGWVGRAFLPQVKPKYLNTPGMKCLWGVKKNATVAIVTEGIMDALRVEKALMRSRSMVAVARLGSAITAFEMDQLKLFSQVIAFPDEDRAGVKAADALCMRCKSRGIPVSVVVPQKMTGRDPGDMDEDEIWEKLHMAMPWSEAVIAERPNLRLQLAATKGGLFE